MPSPDKYQPRSFPNKRYSKFGFQAWRAVEKPEQIYTPLEMQDFTRKEKTEVPALFEGQK